MPLIETITALRSRARAWRRPLLALAVAVFLIGLGLSISATGLGASDVHPGPALVLFAVMVPASLILSALNLRYCAYALDRDIPLARGFVISAIGTVTEILPIPGGLIVRGAALVQSGAGTGETAALLFVTAMLTLAMSVAGGSAVIIASGYGEGLWTGAAAGLGMLACLVWMVLRIGLRLSAILVLIRLLQILLGSLRVMLGFAVIGLSIVPFEAILFVLAGSVGSAVSIIPAGIGLSESIAAALASLVDISPAVAFLVVSINRIIGFVGCGVVAFAYLVWTGQWRAPRRGNP